jgi:hypothetical protein
MRRSDERPLLAQVPTPQNPTLRRAFEARAWARARLYAEGELELLDAVDELQAAAEQSGRVDEIGQDAVQAIMAEAFAAVRDDLKVVGIVPDALPDDNESPGCDFPPRSTIDAAEYLIRLNDPKQFEAWLLKHSAAERAAIIAHINKRRRS